MGVILLSWLHRVGAEAQLFLSPSTEEDFEKLPKSTVPEMQRSNLAPVILQLKALGIDNVLRFPFLSVSAKGSHLSLGWGELRRWWQPAESFTIALLVWKALSPVRQQSVFLGTNSVNNVCDHLETTFIIQSLMLNLLRSQENLEKTNYEVL